MNLSFPSYYFCRKSRSDVVRADFAFNGVMLMLKACPTCGKVHEYNTICPKRIAYEKQRQAQYDRSKYKYDRTTKADLFRNTKIWQCKRREIQDRDLHLCRYCFLVRHKITTDGLSVHHILPLAQHYAKRLQDSNLITLCRSCHEQAEKGLIPADELKRLTKIQMRL